jgi:hypothetical protein
MLHHKVANTNHDWDTWKWIVELLAAELARLPQPSRRELIDALVAKAGYPAFDFGDDPAIRAHNARLQLALDVAARARAG